MSPSETILAVASPPGHSLRGIIRISGAAAFDLVDRLLDENPQRRHVRGSQFVKLRLGSARLPIVLFRFAAPHSYTGEDSLEIQSPGNPMLLQRIVDAILDAARAGNIDARIAHPGEFTARAFFNGRISLLEAEGVAATIAAQSDAELRAAHELSSGKLGIAAHGFADNLASALALVEAGIDFTDQEDVIAIGPAELHDRLLALRSEITQQLERAVGLEQLRAIPWVVLAGQPNAGKSALFNALLGRERAVVAPIAGTTRDILAEPLTIEIEQGTAEVMLADIAGFDEADTSAVGMLMQQAAQSAIARAELVLLCQPLGENASLQRSRIAASEHSIIVRTKADLARKAEELRIEELRVSSLTGAGLIELKQRIGEVLADRAVSLSADSMALQPRHEAALKSAKANLDETIEFVKPQRYQRSLRDPELIAAAMRSALDDLGALAGDITPDEVLGRVFASFCIGK